jgi:sigma-B regulation protein RsbU (phosphoserine phosphatase)
MRSLMQALAMVIVALATLEATSLVQYYFARKTILKEATRRAEDQLEITNLRINDVMDQVETAVRNNVGLFRRVIHSMPDSLWVVNVRLVESNDVIAGSTIAFTENYFPKKGRLYSPYAFRGLEKIDTTQLGTDTYDYLAKEWFVKPLEKGSGHWSEPYYDEGGGEMVMTTYSVPVTDNKGKVAGVLTADVSLDWLTDQVGSIEGYPGAYSVMASGTGHLMVCPAPALVMNYTIQELAADMGDDSAVETAQAMLAGEKGSRLIRDKGKKEYVFYAPIERAGWSMAIIVPYKEIYSDVLKNGLFVILLQLIGIALMGYILSAAARSQRRLQDVTEKKSRIESELQIARNIQMAMLPKTFPHYPESKDIDMAGEIVPAKEVGGDLYDFFIREDKLYFCIGDVSGKGVPASLVMAVTRSLFRSVSAHETSPLRIVTLMNDSMSETNENNMFVTFFLGVLDLITGHLRYCNAGHNAPVRMGPEKAESLDVIPNLPLGVMSGMRYQEQETDLASGEGLFLYTDGLTEAENVDHVLFGDQKMLEAVSRHGGEKAGSQLKSMASEVKTHIHGCEPSDDLTMLVVRFTNPSPASGSERHLILHNDIREIPQLATFMETIAAETKMDSSLAMSLNLALEEAVSNVILYAYPKGSDGLVDVEAYIHEDRLDFIVTDSGRPFDPTSVADPDLTLDVKDRPVGGLGIYLVKSIMDHVSYARQEGKNILSMTKKR